MQRFINFKLLPAAISLAALTAYASVPDGEIKSITKQAERIQANPGEYLEGFEILSPSESVVRLAEEVVGTARDKAFESMPKVAADYGIEMEDPNMANAMTGEWVDILVSRSMGEAELSRTIAAAENSNIPVRFVFRGIAEGQKINDAFLDYGRWTSGLDNPPQAILDPTIFQDQGVSSVPAMFYMKDDQVLASVEGLTNPTWLKRAVERGERGFLGVQGPVLAIAERDLIEVMQERAGKLDLESRKQETVDTYWTRADFIRMEPAVTDERKIIDPSFVLNEALEDPHGNVLVPGGTVINPLAMRPFTLRLIVFNPTREAEVQWVSDLVPAPGLEDMLIATEIDRDGGWDGFEALEDHFDSPIFMMQPDVRQRFELERTPSLVTSESYRFIVEEFAVQDSVAAEGMAANQP